MKLFLDLKDKRISFLKKWLEDKGFETKEFCVENIKNIEKNDLCLLPPSYKISSDLANILPMNIKVLSGNIEENIKDVFSKKNIYHFSFMSDEIYVLKNAALTAEGMLAELIKHTSKSIFDQKILILGGGRVAKAVGLLLFKIGIKFDLATRNEVEYQTAHLVANKCFLGKSFVEELCNYDVVINTIPAKYFDNEELKNFKDNCVVFELASKQCLEGLKIENFKYILCPALPSVYSFESAADILKDQIEQFLKKEI